MDRAIVRKATEKAVERLHTKVERARATMLAAIEAHTTANQELALAIDRLERMQEKDDQTGVTFITPRSF